MAFRNGLWVPDETSSFNAAPPANLVDWFKANNVQNSFFNPASNTNWLAPTANAPNVTASRYGEVSNPLGQFTINIPKTQGQADIVSSVVPKVNETATANQEDFGAAIKAFLNQSRQATESANRDQAFLTSLPDRAKGGADSLSRYITATLAENKGSAGDLARLRAGATESVSNAIGAQASALGGVRSRYDTAAGTLGADARLENERASAMLEAALRSQRARTNSLTELETNRRLDDVLRATKAGQGFSTSFNTRDLARTSAQAAIDRNLAMAGMQRADIGTVAAKRAADVQRAQEYQKATAAVLFAQEHGDTAAEHAARIKLAMIQADQERADYAGLRGERLGTNRYGYTEDVANQRYGTDLEGRYLGAGPRLASEALQAAMAPIQLRSGMTASELAQAHAALGLYPEAYYQGVGMNVPGQQMPQIPNLNANPGGGGNRYAASDLGIPPLNTTPDTTPAPGGSRYGPSPYSDEGWTNYYNRNGMNYTPLNERGLTPEQLAWNRRYKLNIGTPLDWMVPSATDLAANLYRNTSGFSPYADNSTSGFSQNLWNWAQQQVAGGYE